MAAANNSQERDTFLPFTKVLREELNDLRERRKEVLLNRSWTSSTPEATESDPDRLRRLRRESLDNDLVGLALSGGGIRSATFNLGLLQGLAQLGLLKRMDYLATVSGGGFIGGWLTAWIKREGSVVNVEKQLHPNHVVEATADRWRGQVEVKDNGNIRAFHGPVLDEEPEPIAHLRAYSSYLAPRLGLLSADGWVLLAIYLRNLLLNQLVLLLVVLALLFGMGFILQVFAVFAYVPDIPRWQEISAVLTGAGALLQADGTQPAASVLTALGGAARSGAATDTFPGAERAPFVWIVVGVVALLTLAVACWNIRRSVQELDKPSERSRSRTAIHHLHLRTLIPLLITAVLVSLLSMYCLGPLESEVKLLPAVWFAAGFAFFHTLFNAGSWRQLFSGKPVNPRWLLSGVTAGAVGGLLLYVLLIRLHALTEESPAWVPLCVTLAPPLVLLVFVLTGFVQVGVLGRLLEEPHREWWSSLGGWVLIYATMWAALFGAGVFGPWLVLSTAESSWFTRLTVALTWIASVAGGIWTAHSTQTGTLQGGARPISAWGTWLQDLLARVAPAIFLLGLFVLVSLLSARLIEGDWPPNRETFLSHLNNANGPPFITRWAEGLGLAGAPYAWIWTLVFLAIGSGIFLVSGVLIGRCVDVNIFSLQGMYANRLIRCYLGASRRKRVNHGERSPGAPMNSHGPMRRPHPITGFDPLDDLPLAALRTGELYRQPKRAAHEANLNPAMPSSPDKDNQERRYWGPFPIIVTALNLVQGEELAWLERKAEAFTLTPRHCGCLTTGYQPTDQYAGGLSLGTAQAISGAAISPNMGYHSEPAVTALLTVFNARLGAWLGNPKCKDYWRHEGPRTGLFYLLQEMFGRTTDQSKYVYLSDGGHFDNLGVYELIRRRCRFIILCDSGADPDFDLSDLGNLIRKVRIDFGVRIDLDVQGLKPKGPNRQSAGHVTIGKIYYGDVDGSPRMEKCWDFKPDQDEGLLVYIKPTLTGDEPADIENYATQHPSFPHQTTLDQFFTESQFESYRALGYHCVQAAFGDTVDTRAAADGSFDRKLFNALYDRWYPPPPRLAQALVQANAEYEQVHDALRRDSNLRWLSAELYPQAPGSADMQEDNGAHRPREAHLAERHMIARMLTVMESAWFSLHLARYRLHPAHSGWMEVYRRWMLSPTVQANWPVLRQEFSQEFQKFIEGMLAPTQQPMAGT